MPVSPTLQHLSKFALLHTSKHHFDYCTLEKPENHFLVRFLTVLCATFVWTDGHHAAAILFGVENFAEKQGLGLISKQSVPLAVLFEYSTDPEVLQQLTSDSRDDVDDLRVDLEYEIFTRELLPLRFGFSQQVVYSLFSAAFNMPSLSVAFELSLDYSFHLASGREPPFIRSTVVNVTGEMETMVPQDKTNIRHPT